MEMNKNINLFVKEIIKYGTWHDVKNNLPSIKEGDGNVVMVGVITEKGLRGQALYGTSGAPNEGLHFFRTIKTDCGIVITMDEIIKWKYIKI